MIFSTQGEKIKETRKYLKMKQEDLQDTNISRGLISMIETDRRVLTKDVAIKLVEKFKQKSMDLDMEFKIDENFLLRSPAEDAKFYCMKKLEMSNMKDNIEEIFKIACKFDLLEVKASFYRKKGDFYQDKKDYDNAFINYNDAITIYKDIKQDKMIPNLYWKLGLCKAKAFQYNDSLLYFDICKRYSVMYNDTETQQLLLYDLALSYKKLNKFDLALENIEKYLLSSSKEDDFYFYANILKANCYEATVKYDIVIEIYHCLLTEFSKSENPVLVYIYNNLGLAYLDKTDFKTSLEYFEMAEKTANKLDKPYLCRTLIEKSEVFLKQQLYTEAIKTINLGLEYAEIYKDNEYFLKGNYNLLHIYEAMGDPLNLKKTYSSIINLLKATNNSNELISAYVGLSIIYLNENDVEEAKKCLILSQKLYGKM